MFSEIAYAMGQSGAGQQAPPGGGLMSLAPLILIFIIFYFLLIRPQQKKTRAHQEMINALKVDDRVVTTGGIYGRLTKVEDNTVTLEVADKVRIKVLRQNIAGLQSAGAAAGQEQPKNTTDKKNKD